MFSLAQQMLIIKFLSLPIPPLFPLNTTSYRVNPTDSPSELTFSLSTPPGQVFRAYQLRVCGSGDLWFYLVLIWIDLLILPGGYVGLVESRPCYSVA